MTSFPSRSKEWERIRTLENALAILYQINERRRVIQAQAYHEASWDQVFIEAKQMQDELVELRTLLSERWGELFAEVEGDGDG